MRLLILLSILLMVACTDQRGPATKQTGFFSIASYIADYLTQEDSIVDVSKIITVDGKAEKQMLKGYHLHRDIEGFTALDINKAALWDKYSADTVSQKNQQVITYQALDETLLVQSMKITLENNNVQRIEIIKRTSTFLADVSTEYNWSPQEGYTLIRDEDRIFAEPTHHEIVVRKN